MNMRLVKQHPVCRPDVRSGELCRYSRTLSRKFRSEVLGDRAKEPGDASTDRASTGPPVARSTRAVPSVSEVKLLSTILLDDGMAGRPSRAERLKRHEPSGLGPICLGWLPRAEIARGLYESLVDRSSCIGNSQLRGHRGDVKFH